MKSYKSFFSSWSIWFGIIQIVYGGAGLLSGLLESNTAMTIITTGIGTIGLRIKTTQPLGL